MSSAPPPKFLSPATWISIVPAAAAMTLLAIMGVVVDASLAAFGFGVLTALGLAPMISLIAAAKAEAARGASGGRFIPRFLILAGTFIGYLLGTAAIAIAAGLAPAPFVWIFVQTLGIAPAAITAAILTGRSHRLPIEP